MIEELNRLFVPRSKTSCRYLKKYFEDNYIFKQPTPSLIPQQGFEN